jgi:hypothetical protein
MEGGEVSFTSNATLPAIERIVTAKYRRGAELNRQHPSWMFCCLTFTESGEALDLSELVREQTTMANPTTAPFGVPKFEMANMEVPAEFREMTNKGLAHARDAYAKAKVASEEAGDLLQNTYMTVATGATNYNLKVIAIARTNTRAAFDCAHELLGASLCRNLSSCRPRTSASSLTSSPRKIGSFGR